MHHWGDIWMTEWGCYPYPSAWDTGYGGVPRVTWSMPARSQLLPWWQYVSHVIMIHSAYLHMWDFKQSYISILKHKYDILLINQKLCFNTIQTCLSSLIMFSQHKWITKIKSIVNRTDKDIDLWSTLAQLSGACYLVFNLYPCCIAKTEAKPW